VRLRLKTTEGFTQRDPVRPQLREPPAAEVAPRLHLYLYAWSVVLSREGCVQVEALPPYGSALLFEVHRELSTGARWVQLLYQVRVYTVQLNNNHVGGFN
jgi:hypothetical protein